MKDPAETYPMGRTLRFHDGTGENERVGSVNGVAFEVEYDGSIYIPVYVREGDKCLIVHHRNVIE